MGFHKAQENVRLKIAAQVGELYTELRKSWVQILRDHLILRFDRLQSSAHSQVLKKLRFQAAALESGSESQRVWLRKVLHP